MKNRLVAFLLLLCLLLTALPALSLPAAAEEKEPAFTASAPEVYENAYVQDGLKGLFLAYKTSFDEFDTSDGRVGYGWENKRGGGIAKFRGGVQNTDYWYFDEQNGGFSYRLTHEEYQPKRDTLEWGITFPAELIRSQSCYVETVASFVGITGEDGMRHAAGSAYAYSRNVWAFRFGYVGSLSFPEIKDTIGDNSSFDNRWYASATLYQAINTDKTHGADRVKRLVWESYLDGSLENSIENMRVFRRTENDGSLYFSVGYNCNPIVGKATLSAIEYGKITAEEIGDGGPEFSLFNNYPCTVYAVRVYDRELTDAEIKQNHFVDVMAKNGIPLENYIDLPGDEKKLFHDVFADVPVATDASAAWAMFCAAAGDHDATADMLLSSSTVRPCEDDYGIELFVGVNEVALSALKKVGYTFTFGVAAAPGTGEITVDAEDGEIALSRTGSVTTTDADGLYTDGQSGAFGYAGAVRYDNTAYFRSKVTLRGFAVLTDAEGNTRVVYAPEDTVLGNTLSLEDVAKYYVNEYDGALCDVFRFRSNPYLGSVLDKLGIERTRSFPGEECFYVDPENGDDENDGRSKKTPFASLSAANEAINDLLAGNGKYTVRLILSEGIHRLEKPFTLDGANIKAEDYYISVEGQGEATEITSTVSVGTAGEELTAPDGALFRDLYYRDADGMLRILPIVHAGDSEHTYLADDCNIEEGFIYMPKQLFDGVSSYAGTEIHITVEWDFNILLIDHVDYTRTLGNKVAVYPEAVQFNSMALPGNNKEQIRGRDYWLVGGQDLWNNYEGDEDAFWFDRETGDILIYDAPEDDTLDEDTEIEVPLCDNLFVLRDVDGFSIRDAVLTGTNDDNVNPQYGLHGGQAGSNAQVHKNTGVVDNKAIFFTQSALFGVNVAHFTAEGLYVREVSGDGISLRGKVSNVDIRRNEFTGLGGSAIRVGTTDTNGARTAESYNDFVTIEDNAVSYTGRLYVNDCGIYIAQARECRVIGNTVTNTTYTGISVGWGHGAASYTESELGGLLTQRTYHVEIAYNYFTDILTCMRDGAAIYTLGGNAATDVHTLFNYMHDNFTVLSEETGKHQANTRAIYVYYHDDSGTSWRDDRNVVINNAEGPLDRSFAFYYQCSTYSNIAYNISAYDSYAIGFDRAHACRGAWITKDIDGTWDTPIPDDDPKSPTTTATCGRRSPCRRSWTR